MSLEYKVVEAGCRSDCLEEGVYNKERKEGRKEGERERNFKIGKFK